MNPIILLAIASMVQTVGLVLISVALLLHLRAHRKVAQ
jgi:hypothetical protein